jgi:hypothetical protein
METIQYEAVKVALKQDRNGFMLTLSIHPDEIPEKLIRDFVGARYQVVMVRLNGEEQPMNRIQEHGIDPVKLAAILCKDKYFHQFLVELGEIFEPGEEQAIEWLREKLHVQSRSEIRENPQKARLLLEINETYKAWKQNV